jgi:hypothetical protein
MTIWQAGAARTASQACDKKLDWSIGRTDFRPTCEPVEEAKKIFEFFVTRALSPKPKPELFVMNT